ncbi:MAG: molybdopterin-dependent oxidoreductase, partial [Dehalococcoidia bacterium]|nr:molybdopterin-dependent oxidoreductase [Dehalococcoidia bacterium]
WLIWRGNALMSSAKGHEYFLKHFLGTHTNVNADEVAKGTVNDVTWHDQAPQGKLDLMVDINFRMDTSALYSDIVLPTATWYEKDDLNSTDLHTYIHPLSKAATPAWEAKCDWDIFKALASKISEMAPGHFAQPVKDIVAVPLQHDTIDEIAQPEVKDWTRGECNPIPGKTMPHLKIVERDYVNLYKRFISFGPLARQNGIGAHGVRWGIRDDYDELLKSSPTQEWNGAKYPSLEEPQQAANVILNLAPETNGDVAYRAYEEEEQKVGLPLKDLAESGRGVKHSFADLQAQPARLLNSPCWSGIINNGRTYSPFCINTERLVPWRTLTGRQQFYHDHQVYLAFGENLPAYKPNPNPTVFGDFVKSKPDEKSIMLNYLIPHGKWHIHSTYFYNELM